MSKEKTDFSRLSQRELAEAHGVTTRTIRKWSHWGLPRNPDQTYVLSETIAWRLRNSNWCGTVYKYLVDDPPDG